MSGPCLSSSVTGRPLRPATRQSLGEPLPHQLADRPRAPQKAVACATFDFGKMSPLITCGINSAFAGLFHTWRQMIYVLRTLSPLSIRNIATPHTSLDLHVLSTPPAFVLSQNQTLRKKITENPVRRLRQTRRSCDLLSTPAAILTDHHELSCLKACPTGHCCPIERGSSRIAQFNL